MYSSNIYRNIRASEKGKSGRPFHDRVDTSIIIYRRYIIIDLL